MTGVGGGAEYTFFQGGEGAEYTFFQGAHFHFSKGPGWCDSDLDQTPAILEDHRWLTGKDASEGYKVTSVRSLASGKATAPKEDEQGAQM